MPCAAGKTEPRVKISRGPKNAGVVVVANIFTYLSLGVHEATAQGTDINGTELCDALGDRDTPGKIRRECRHGRGWGVGNSRE